MRKSTLSVLSSLSGIFAGVIAGALTVFKVKQKEKEEWRSMSNKHLALMLLLNQWLITKQEGKSIVEYFHRNAIKSIAIYGMSYVGERLFDELKNSDVEVRYAIDKDAPNLSADINVVSLNEEMPEVDAIIVTPICFFSEIQETLTSKVDYQIISLEDVLYEI